MSSWNVEVARLKWVVSRTLEIRNLPVSESLGMLIKTEHWPSLVT